MREEVTVVTRPVLILLYAATLFLYWRRIVGPKKSRFTTFSAVLVTHILYDVISCCLASPLQFYPVHISKPNATYNPELHSLLIFSIHGRGDPFLRSLSGSTVEITQEEGTHY
uniref:Serpentine receptor class gamma n=1 Tax=Steinernema glaseri TaxID=37863 RepID=A0A1I7ZDE1_9BILA